MATFIWADCPNAEIDIPGRPARMEGLRVVPGVTRSRVRFEDGVLQAEDAEIVEAVRAMMPHAHGRIVELGGPAEGGATLALVGEALRRLGATPVHDGPELTDAFRG